MIRSSFFYYLCISLSIALFIGCQGDDDDNGPDPSIPQPILPASPFDYTLPNLPGYFNTPPIQNQDNTPAANLVTNAGATLGRVLFYDKNLSQNNTIACASCHQQEHGFSDPDAFSKGFNNGLTGRHSMGLTQARYYAPGSFFWDQRAATLEDQVLMPIQDPVEMGMELDALVQKLAAIDYYEELFTDAFGDKTITADRISRALAQFVRAMVSYDSKFDQGLQAIGPNQAFQVTDFPNFSASENQGKLLFFSNITNCATCHGTTNFVAPGPRNNGLDAMTTDPGLGDVTNNPNDEGLFKVNSLRNIAVTAPFMHDGRFETLAQVIEHYDNNVQPHPNLSPTLRVGGVGGPAPDAPPRRLNLRPDEKQALIDFLHTLTDETLLNDEKFTDPFEN
jgi:cytochrome c peroxidase